MKRRDVLRIGGTALAGLVESAAQTTGTKKTVIVIGAGIAGLSCAYELVRRGHDATVLEASVPAAMSAHSTTHLPTACMPTSAPSIFIIRDTRITGATSRSFRSRPFPIRGGTTWCDSRGENASRKKNCTAARFLAAWDSAS